MKALIQNYNAIETMSGRVLFTDASMKDILDTLKKSNFVEIDGCITAVNQVTLVRVATGKEYFEKFILHTLEVAIKGKMKSWIEQIKDPTIEHVMKKVEEMREEEEKYQSMFKQFTPEEIEARRKRTQEMRKGIKFDRAWIDEKEIKA